MNIYFPNKGNIVILTSIILALLICACSLFQQEIENTIPSFPFPHTGLYDSIIRDKNGELLVLMKENSYGVWSFAKENNDTFESFTLPLEPETICSLTDYYIDETLPDGELLVRKICHGITRSSTSLFTYNLQTRELDTLVSSLPTGTLSVSWNPSQTRAVAYLDSGFSSGTLFWVLNDGYEPMDLVVGQGDHSWNMKDDFPDFSGSKKGETGNVGYAEWSPDGDTIAFFASPDAIGVTPSERFRVAYNLYFMNVENLKPYSIQEGIYYPHILKWSPNSRYIAFIGRMDYLDQKGIWLYSLDSKSISLISEGDYRTIVWREDSTSLVAIHCEELLRCSEIREFNLKNFAQ